MSKIVKLPKTKQVQLGNLTLQLRLGTKDIFNIEDRLRQSIMGLFMGGQGEFTLPTIKQVAILLQGANQVSGVKDSDIFEAIDQYLEEGNSTMDLIRIVQEFLGESGFFGSDTEVKDKKKGEVNFDDEAPDFEV